MASAVRQAVQGNRIVRLNIGCGQKRLPDCVNLDISANVGADVVHNLDKTPWPFAADSFDEVHAYDVLEHVENVVSALEEIHRISRPGAVLHATVPHFSSANAFTDVTHRHWFGWRSFEPFDSSHQLAHYSNARFRRRYSRISFEHSIVNHAVFRLANRWPHEYERRWAWMFPAWFLYFQLEVVK
jgi:SAM-dependent methyltransferase